MLAGEVLENTLDKKQAYWLTAGNAHLLTGPLARPAPLSLPHKERVISHFHLNVMLMACNGYLPYDLTLLPMSFPLHTPSPEPIEDRTWETLGAQAPLLLWGVFFTLF